MWQLLISLGIIGADYAYNRWISPPPGPPGPSEKLSLPTTTVGSPVPLLYGRIRVPSPVLAFCTPPTVQLTSVLLSAEITAGAVFSPYLYAMDMAFVLGIGFRDFPSRFGPIAPNVQLYNVWAGQTPLLFYGYNSGDSTGVPGISTIVYEVGYAQGAPAGTDASLSAGPRVEILPGGAGQTLIDGSGNPLTYFGVRLAAYGLFGTRSPSYRNYITALLFNSTANTPTGVRSDITNGAAWYLGVNGDVPGYQFEVSSYPPSGFYNGGMVGEDVNPVDVLYDLFVGTFAKANIPSSYIDMTSWGAAAETLYYEGNGFSRCWDEQQTMADMVSELLSQMGGTLYEDPETGLIGLKLIRADYDPNSLLEINPSNCDEIENFQLGGWTDIPNRIQITFNNRGIGYQQDTAFAQNQGNYFGQAQLGRVSTVSYPGVTTLANAQALADRETMAQSRPLAKCSANVTRDFLRCKIGDPIFLTWPEAGISQMVMRIAAIDKGTLSNNTIKLDLLQDYFYQYKKQPPVNLTGFVLGS
jgi:Putative phage tail protein